MIYLAALLLVLHLIQIALLINGRLQSRLLPEEASISDMSWPSVSIIVAARDEEAEIEAALCSLLHLDYPDFEVIAVNDRSTDGTGAVLERMRGQWPQLRMVTIDALPAGWLGKNHALQRGVQEAQGSWLLFTDADIVFDPSTLKRAIALAHAEKLDHLTLVPAIRSNSFWINRLVGLFARNFALLARPWKARDPKSPCHIGIGAFNLVRRSSYEAVGGHATIRLRPDDDLKLGKILKRAGFRQEIAFGCEVLSLQWYPSLPAMVRGLEKNVLAGVDYRLGSLLVGLTILLIYDIGPWLLILLGDGLTMLTAGSAGLLSMLSVALFYPRLRLHWGWAVLTPLLSLMLTWIFLRSAFLTLYRGGIFWRGNFYSLPELKQNQV